MAATEIKFDQIGDVVGLQEIAVLLGVDDRTPHAWLYRKRLPVPDFASVNGLRAWKRKTIVKWAAETGRPHPEGLLDDEIAKLKLTPSEGPRGGRQAAADARKALAKAGA